MGGICMSHIGGYEDACWKVYWLNGPLHHRKGTDALHQPCNKQLVLKLCRIHRFSPFQSKLQIPKCLLVYIQYHFKSMSLIIDKRYCSLKNQSPDPLSRILCLFREKRKTTELRIARELLHKRNGQAFESELPC